MRITKKQAVIEQINAAMKHYEAEEFACAITLAAAAEDAMPPGGTKSLFELSRDAFAGYASTKEIVSTLNAKRDSCMRN